MDNLKYYFSGMISGICGTIVSHPFFTIKTHLQNGEFLKCRNMNIKWLYRGFTPALTGYSIEKMLVFGSYKTIYNSLRNKSISDKQKIFFSGFMSGVIASVSITVFEQITISMQRNINITKYKQLFSGFLPTMARESVGFSIYFSVYEYLSNKYNKNKETLKTALIGIPSITSAWLVITPIDKIKTNIQSNVKIDIHNIGTAYKGFLFVMLRAIPFHTTCFVVFEFMNKYL